MGRQMGSRERRQKPAHGAPSQGVSEQDDLEEEKWKEKRPKEGGLMPRASRLSLLGLQQGSYLFELGVELLTEGPDDRVTEEAVDGHL